MFFQKYWSGLLKKKKNQSFKEVNSNQKGWNALSVNCWNEISLLGTGQCFDLSTAPK